MSFIYTLDICSLIHACMAERATAHMEAIGVQFGGGMMLVGMFIISVISFITYWLYSSTATVEGSINKKKLFLVSMGLPLSAMLVFLIILWPRYFSLVPLLVSLPISVFIVSQIHWPLLMSLKERLLSNERNGEKLCLN